MPPSLETAPPPAGLVKGAGTRLVIAVLGMGLALTCLFVLRTRTGSVPDTLVKQGDSRLPVLGDVPEFSFPEASGSVVSRESLLGRVWVADFVFTSCGGTCPVMSANMGELHRRIGLDPGLRDRVRFVSFSLDPERDTPDALESHAARFQADRSRWFFARGEFEAIQKFALEGFKLGVHEGVADSVEPIVHSQSFVLIDAEGRIRGYFDGTNGAVMNKLAEAIGRLAGETAR